MVMEMESLKRASIGLPVAKSPSFGGSIKNIPQDPRDQSVFFYRKLLRAESYRKALVWQKRWGVSSRVTENIFCLLAAILREKISMKGCKFNCQLIRNKTP